MAHNRCTVRRPGSGSQLVLLALSFSIVIPLFGWAFFEKWWGGAVQDGPLTCLPHRGTFVHEIVEKGTIECASNVEVRCEVSARDFFRTTILEVVPEGTYVEPGDFLVRLDSAPLEQLRIAQIIQCNSSEAALAQAENWLETTRFTLQEYIDGLLPKEKGVLGADLDRAREMLRRSEQTLSLTQSMYRRGFVTRMSLEADSYAAEQAKLELEKAETKLSVLENYTSKKRLKSLESNLAVAEASVKWRRHVHDLTVKELENIEQQIGKCVITSPLAGQVVLAHMHHDGHSHMIEPGQTVWLQRPLVRLPNSQEMQVYASIREDQVVQVRPGLETRIRLEAFPGAELRGKVEVIDEFPTPNEWWGSQAKRYAAKISIDPKTIQAAGISLRPGLSAEVRIRVETRPDQLMLPFQAVLKHGEKQYCITHDHKGFQAREVTLGGTNGKYVVVIAGIEENQRVVLGAENYRREVALPGAAGNRPSPERLILADAQNAP